MRFPHRLAPIHAGVFPLVNKGGMPELAESLYLELRRRYRIQYDAKQSIGKRYARMDEAGPVLLHRRRPDRRGPDGHGP